MKKLCLILVFAVSGFAFAHCGTCGVGEKSKSCKNADGTQCSSSDAHHEDAQQDDTDSNTAEDAQAETEENSAE